MTAQGFKDAYDARRTVEEALAWLHDSDGWTRGDLEDLALESVDLVCEDDTA